MNKTLKQRIAQVTKEKISLVPYNPTWPTKFQKEATYLRKILPKPLIKRIEHFGSTAIPGICAKPIIDILIEVTSLKETRKKIVPTLKSKNYDYFWRPTIGDQPPYYAWFIKRDSQGNRTHHLHMVEKDSQLWDRLYFRDYLRQFPQQAKKYDQLKQNLSRKYSKDRIKYTQAKTKLITILTNKAKKYYLKSKHLRTYTVPSSFLA